MHFTSYTQIPNASDFQDMPESAKRLAVSIMNILEEKGLIGEAAGKQTLEIVKSITGNIGMMQPGQQNKVAMDLGSMATMANVAGMVSPVARQGANFLNTALTAKGAAEAGIQGYKAGSGDSNKGNPILPVG